MRGRAYIFTLLAICLFLLASLSHPAGAYEQAIENGFAWLFLQQNEESGSWGDDPVRETAIVLKALAMFEKNGQERQAATLFLEQTHPQTTEHLCRKITGLSTAGEVPEEDLSVLESLQNPDGGFGFAAGYPSSPVDSLIAAEALHCAGVEDKKIIGKLLYYLVHQQQSDGGFAFAAGNPSSLSLTAYAAYVLSGFQPQYQLAAFLKNCITFLLWYQDSRGGFGEGDSSAGETALCLLGLSAVGSCEQEQYTARQFLALLQDEEGSWDSDPATTALVLTALHHANDLDKPNLTIEYSSLEIFPPTPVVGQQAEVRCTVKNTGTVLAEHVSLALFDALPEAGGRQLSKAEIDAIPAGNTATARLYWTALEHHGSCVYYLKVDPDNSVNETNEQDNMVGVAFTISTQADLVVEPGSFVIDAPAPRAGETFAARAVIRNLGEADACPVRVVCQIFGTEEPFLNGLNAGEILFSEIPGSGAVIAHFSLQLPAGSYTLKVSVDPDNQVVESNDQNNTASLPFNVFIAEFQGIDLSLHESSIQFDPLESREGEEVRITVSVHNSGDRDAYSVPVVVHDEFAGDHAFELARHVFPLIRTGATERMSVSAAFPAGEHRITAIVDPDDVIDETNSVNNAASKILNIHPSYAVRDLEVLPEDIFIEPREVVAGQEVKITCRVHNTGTVRLENIPVKIFKGDPDAGAAVLDNRYPEFTLAAIDPGSAGNILLYYDTTNRAGTFPITLVVDPDDHIAEDREDNNRAAKLLTVYGGSGQDVEITATGIQIIPQQPVSGDVVTITATVINNGAADANMVKVSFLCDGTLLGFDIIESLPAGASAQATFVWDTTGRAGSHLVEVSVDPDNGISEINEYNNTTQISVLLQCPDLAISSEGIDVDPSLPFPGTDITLRCRIRNIGHLVSPENTVSLYRGNPDQQGELIMHHEVTALEPSAEVIIPFVWHAPENAGSHKLYLRVDSENVVLEENEANNTALRTVTTVTAADLVVDAAALTVSPENPSIADPIALSGQVENLGGMTAEHIQITIYEGEPREDASNMIGTGGSIARLHPGARADFTAPLYLGAGEHKVCIVVSTEPEQQEQRFDNNKACKEIYCTSYADLEVRAQEMDVTPLQPSLGDTVRVSGLVRNRSDQVHEDVVVRFYDGIPGAGGYQIGAGELSLAGGASVRAEAAFVPQCAGLHDVWVVVDPDNIVPEENKGNNRACRQVVISSPEPDLALTQGAFQLSPVQPNAGDMVRIRIRVGNYGKESATAVVVRLFDEKDESGETQVIGEVRVPLVEAEGSAMAEQTCVFTAGEHRIRAVVDPDNLIRESHEGNNELLHSVRIGDADVLYDDCGNPDNEPHRVHGEDRALENFAPNVPLPLRTCSTDPTAVIYRYENLSLQARYELVIGYVQETGMGCAQQLYADKVMVHDTLLLPEEKPQYFTYRLPAPTYQDGTVELRFERVSGMGALVSEIYLVKKTGEKEAAITNAAQWLEQPEHQDIQGGFIPFVVSFGDGLSLQALAVNGAQNNPVYQALLTRVHELQATNGSWDNDVRSTSQCITGLAAAGERMTSEAIRRGVDFLLRTQDDSGGWKNDIIGTGMAMIALLDAGLDKSHESLQRARQWLISIQNSDGFWGEVPGGPSDLFRGYHPVVALIRAGSAQDAAVQKAIAYFKNRCSVNNCRLVYGYLEMLYHSGVTSGSEVTYWKNALLGLQRSDGGWRGGSGYADLSVVEYTAEALTILGMLGGAQQNIQQGVAWIASRNSQRGDVFDITATVKETALSACALYTVNPIRYNDFLRNLITLIINRQHSSGTWGTRYQWGDDGCNVDATAFFLWALSDIGIAVPGKSTALTKAQQALFRLQNSTDYGWFGNGCTGYSSSVRSTSLALFSLLRSGVSPHDNRIARAVTWLLAQRFAHGLWDSVENSARSIMVLKMLGNREAEFEALRAALEQQQNADGGWGTPDSSVVETAWALYALSSTGYSGTALYRGVLWLLSAQNSDGGWAALPGIPASNTGSTAMAVKALVACPETDAIDVGLVLNKKTYYPGDLVRVMVQSLSENRGFYRVSGTVTEQGGAVYPLTCVKEGSVFVGTYPIRDDHVPGTDIISIIASGTSEYGFATASFSVAPLFDAVPDIVLQDEDISLPDQILRNSQPFEVQVLMHNQTIRDAVTVPLYCYDGNPDAGGRILYQTTTERICGQETVTLRFPITLQAGLHELYCVADPENTIAEQSKRNNRAKKQLMVVRNAGLPNFFVQSSDFSVTPQNPAAGESVLIKAQIRNDGDGAGPVLVRFLDGTIPIGGDVTIPWMEPSSSQAVTIVWDTFNRAGKHYLHAVVDPDNTLEEINELDNDALSIVTVGEAVLPDVLVEQNGLTCSTNTPHEGETVTIHATITNRGTPVSAVGIALYDGDPVQENLINTAFMYEALRAGESTSVEFTVDTAGMAGVHMLTIVIDPDNLIDESDEENNIGRLELAIAPCEIQASVATDLPQYQAGAQARISAHINNTAPDARQVSLTMRIRDEAHNIVHEMLLQTQQDVPANSDILVEYPLTIGAWQAGKYVVEVLAEEGNWCRTRAAHKFMVCGETNVTASLTIVPERAGSHEQVLCRATVQNVSPITVVSDVRVQLTITGSTSTPVYSEEKSIVQLLPGAETTQLFYWNTKTYPYGIYGAQLRIVNHDELIAQDNDTVVVEAGPLGMPLLQASLTLAQPTLYRGEELQAQCRVKNCSPMTLDRIVLNLQAVDTQTQRVRASSSDNCTLTIGEVRETVFSLPTRGLSAGTAMAVLSATISGVTQTLAAAPFVLENRCPVAVVPESLSVYRGTAVLLDGGASYDEDNDTLMFRWCVVEQPEESRCLIEGGDTSQCTFTPDIPGTYGIRLRVSDGLCESSPRDLTLKVANRVPLAHVSAPATVHAGTTVMLDGSTSYDPDGDTLRDYRWSLTMRPAGSTTELIGSGEQVVSLHADVPGVYEVQLVVSDGYDESEPFLLRIEAQNGQPVAQAGNDRIVTVGDRVVLNGTESVDPDNDSITFFWELRERPASSGAALTDPTAPMPEFIADTPGNYVCSLTVRDRWSTSIPDTVTIQARPVTDVCEDREFPEPAFPMKTGYGSDKCRAPLRTIATLSDYERYVAADYGFDGTSYVGIKVTKDITSKTADICFHSPCLVQLKKGIRLCAPHGAVVLDGRMGIAPEGDFKLDAQRIALLSEQGDIRIGSGASLFADDIYIQAGKVAMLEHGAAAAATGSVTIISSGNEGSLSGIMNGVLLSGSGLFMKSNREILIQNLAAMDVRGPVRAIAQGSKSSDAVRIQYAAMHAESLCLSSMYEASVGPFSALYIDGDLRVVSTGNNPAAQARIKTGSVIHAGTVSLIGFRAIVDPWVFLYTPGTFFMQADDPSRCMVRGCYSAGFVEGNCLE